jgi:putative hydrolase of the HAD superfamily
MMFAMDSSMAHANWELRFGTDLDAVIFDIGGVFTVPDHRIIGKALANAGIGAPALSHSAVHRAHFVGVRAFERTTHTTEVMGEHDWMNYYQIVSAAIGVDETQLADAGDAIREVLYGAKPNGWAGVIEENVAGLRKLSDAGVPLAVVSNNDGTAADQLFVTEVAQVGDGPYVPVRIIVDSTTVGIEKPDPRIFAPALESLNVVAHRALYVGDTPHADVRGARAAGMHVVQLDPYELYKDWDHHRVANVAVLADLLLRD